MNRAQLLKHLMPFIYRKAIEAQDALFSSIASAQGTNGFWYKGKPYGVSQRAENLNKALHPAMDTWLDANTQLSQEQLYVSSYLSMVLNICNTEGQLYWLLPQALHSYLVAWDIQKSETPPPVQTALASNETGKQLLLRRLLLNSTEN